MNDAKAKLEAEIAELRARLEQDEKALQASTEDEPEHFGVRLFWHRKAR